MNKLKGTRLYKAARPIWLCCFCFLAISGLAQFTVQDAESGKPLPNAVLSWQSGETIQANESGIISVGSQRATANFKISCPGYMDFEGSGSLLSSPTVINMAPLHEELQPVAITAYDSDALQIQAAASISTVHGEVLRQGFNPSLSDAINQSPGIKMEERGYGGSRRINIRGSMLRSPFAVRNIKMYWNGIPVTSPDGSSPLEMFDQQDIGAMEIIRGPAGSHYGSGTGGVVLLRGGNRKDQGLAGVNFMTGSWGLVRTNASYQVVSEKLRVYTSVATQRTDGYREQEANEKLNAMVSLDYYGSDKLKHHFTGIYYDGSWELPGAIKLDEARETPTMAQPFSIDGNAHVDRNRWWFGLKQDWLISEGNIDWTNETSVYITRTEKLNPYGTSPFFNGLKEEDAVGYGGRTLFQVKPKSGRWQQLVIGAEWQQEDFHLLEWTNNLGMRGDFKYTNSTVSTASSIFASTTVIPWGGAQIDVGASLTQTVFDNEGLSQVTDINTPLDIRIDMGSYFLPRVALTQHIHANGYVYASFNIGNSTPSLFEMVDVSSGVLNDELNPERGQSIEVGYKAIFNDVLFLQANAFQMTLDDAILPQLLDNEQVIFRNAGLVDQKGIESSLRASLPTSANWRVDAQLSFTVSEFRFERYIKEGEVYDGNRLTGVPLAQASSQFQVKFKETALILRHYWYDKAPLDDANSTWAQAYNLVNASLSHDLKLKWIRLQLYGGVNNVFNTLYSSFYQLNGVFGKFYNPSPERNFFGGVMINFGE